MMFDSNCIVGSVEENHSMAHHGAGEDKTREKEVRWSRREEVGWENVSIFK